MFKTLTQVNFMKKLATVTLMIMSFNANALSTEQFDEYSGKCAAYATGVENNQLIKEALEKRININKSQEYAATWVQNYILASKQGKINLLAEAINACKYLGLETDY